MTIQPLSVEYPLRPPRSWRSVTATLTAALALAAVTDRAMAEPYNPDNLPAEQVARIGAICQSVIGVQPGEAHYVGCVVSLTGSLNRLGGGHALAQAREGCLRQGLRPGTPALSECVLRSDQATPLPASVASTEMAAASKVGDLGEATAAKSYFYASPRDVRRRVEMSCAQLGFDPESDAFARCAASLRASLFAADNPSR
jgi:hypothetical protein